jgi:hypothetical protein
MICVGEFGAVEVFCCPDDPELKSELSVLFNSRSPRYDPKKHLITCAKHLMNHYSDLSWVANVRDWDGQDYSMGFNVGCQIPYQNLDPIRSRIPTRFQRKDVI